MRISPTRSLPFLSLVSLMLSCNSYRHLQKIRLSDQCLYKFKPAISRAIYRTSVDVNKKHISGMLLIKTMADSSIRVVFSNAMGFSFFDFGFSRGNEFKVYQIISQMDKKAVIKTLRKDFELVLFMNMQEKNRFTLADSAFNYYGFPQAKGVNYYITDKNCSTLVKMERSSKRKPVVEAMMTFNKESIPDSISIRHLNFNFSITLKKS